MSTYVMECHLTEEQMESLTEFCRRVYNTPSRKFRVFANNDLHDLAIGELKKENVRIGIDMPELHVSVAEALFAFEQVRVLQQDNEGRRNGTATHTTQTAFTHQQLDDFLDSIAQVAPPHGGTKP